ncbi:helix-turn-helix domain-containing protein [Nonomuraea sp. KC401]|uniref:ATP-binding protein n=1 Tax=unclassified Nonomuraea TaxID=2593643 RepID=UPI0010FD05EC|nr:helix-turn-helix domain-containing protein [Nonomuraea sp. KC401]NBE93114.1 helix-turn-helix domain-containing protein [Nonomuraea sp. K271]TLF80329.1 helix-turn-helix domain-containing protein [Nonomuraea sp. KC401]
MDPGAGMSLGALLRMWRQRALLTQEQLAERAGLNVRTVRRLENMGLLRPRATSVLLLAKALELDGAELEMLYAAARGRPAGPDEPPPADPRPWTVPRQLPADVAVPAVRERELAILMEHHSVVCVDGMAGMGKTALAVSAAHRLAPLFPDGQLFVDLHAHAQATAPVDPGAALTRVLRALGVPGEHIPWHLDDRAALYRSVLAQRRILVVLDDAADEHQANPLLPAAPGCRVIITSRRRLACPGDARNLSLDDLPVPEAVALFTWLAGRERDAGASVDVLAEVVRRCGLLPLAIRIAAARLRAHPAWDVRHLLDRLATDRLAELVAGRHSVVAALDRSYERLPAEHRQVYRLLGSVVRPVFGLDAAATLLDVTPAQARRLLDELLDAHLLQEPAPGRYRLHDLVHGHASALWLSAALGGSAECEISAFEQMAGVRLGAE